MCVRVCVRVCSRPASLGDIAGQGDVTRMLALVVGGGGYVPNLLLCGPPGTGKTSVVHILLRHLFPKQWASPECVLHVNASRDTGIDVLRNVVKPFAVGDGPCGVLRRVVVLEEADMLSVDFQFALRCVMEQAAVNGTRFFLACNYGSRVIHAVKSRCTVFYFKALGPATVAAALARIAAAEGITLQPAVLELLQTVAGGDLRTAVTQLQMLVCVAGVEPSVADAARAVGTLPLDKAQHLWDAIVRSGRPCEDGAKVLHYFLQDGPFSGAAVVSALLQVVLAAPLPPAVSSGACAALAACDHALADGATELPQMLALCARLWCVTRK